MSWPFYRAAGQLRLPTHHKMVAIALGDMANVDGTLEASNARIRRWTGQSEQTVRRALRELETQQLLGLVQPPTCFSSAVYLLRYPGAREVGGGATLVGGATESGSPRAVKGVPAGHPSDHLLIPRTTSRKAAAAGASAISTAVENSKPTYAQLLKLAHSVLAEEGFTSIADLNASLRSQAAQLRGFDYAADVDLLNRALSSAIAQHERRASR